MHLCRLGLPLVFLVACGGAAAMSCPPTPAPAPPPPPAAAALTSGQLTTIEGRVAGYTTAQRGEMDGVILDTGVHVHFPPHAGAAMLPLVGRGKALRVTGFSSASAEGTVLELSTVVSSASGQTVDVASMPLPPPPSSPTAFPPGAVAPPRE